MFDLLDRPLHWIPVKWPALIVPENADDVSTPGEYEIDLRVELLDRPEAIWRFHALFDPGPELLKEVEEQFGDTPPDAFDTFKRVVQAWRKIKANGRKVEMTDENIKLLLKTPMFEAAFAVAYVMALGGQSKVREGNSSGLPSGGQEDSAKPATTISKETATVSE